MTSTLKALAAHLAELATDTNLQRSSMLLASCYCSSLLAMPPYFKYANQLQILHETQTCGQRDSTVLQYRICTVTLLHDCLPHIDVGMRHQCETPQARFLWLFSSSRSTHSDGPYFFSLLPVPTWPLWGRARQTSNLCRSLQGIFSLLCWRHRMRSASA